MSSDPTQNIKTTPSKHGNPRCGQTPMSQRHHRSKDQSIYSSSLFSISSCPQSSSLADSYLFPWLSDIRSTTKKSCRKIINYLPPRLRFFGSSDPNSEAQALLRIILRKHLSHLQLQQKHQYALLLKQQKQQEQFERATQKLALKQQQAWQKQLAKEKALAQKETGSVPKKKNTNKKSKKPNQDIVFPGDALLKTFLLNNGGYLDDSEDEGDDEDDDYYNYVPQPLLWSRKSQSTSNTAQNLSSDPKPTNKALLLSSSHSSGSSSAVSPLPCSHLSKLRDFKITSPPPPRNMSDYESYSIPSNPSSNFPSPAMTFTSSRSSSSSNNKNISPASVTSNGAIINKKTHTTLIPRSASLSFKPKPLQSRINSKFDDLKHQSPIKSTQTRVTKNSNKSKMINKSPISPTSTRYLPSNHHSNSRLSNANSTTKLCRSNLSHCTSLNS
ncbi:expressed protein, partial [Phakopsora pachyrhizi]